ncbi:MAG: O-antigen ligase family protein [Thermoleophilia bacterium]
MSEAHLDRRSRLVLVAACLTVLFTAFEVKTPVFSLGPVNFTTSELAAGFLIIASLVYASAKLSWYLPRRALDVAVLLFLLVNFLSAALAAEDKPGAFKFALRMAYAALVYLAVSRLPAHTRSWLWLAGGMTAALMIVTVVGLLENFISAVQWPDLLAPFQEGVITFGTFYNVRVSSTLPFPTVFSMFIELALPLALALGLWLAGRETRRARRLWLEAATVVTLAAVMVLQVFTYTRSALVATPVAMLTGAALAAFYGYGRRVWILMALGVVFLGATVGVSVLFSNKMASRLDVSEQERHYGADYTLTSAPGELALGQTGSARIHIKNTGSITWTSDPDEKVSLGYRWLTYPQKEYYELPTYIITEMPTVVPPGGEVDLTTDFLIPEENGRYVLVYELFKTHVSWFSSAGVPPLIFPLEFINGKSRPLKISESSESFEAIEPAVATSTRSQLWRAGLKVWKDNLVLGVGPDQFRKRYNEYEPGIERDDRVRTHNIFLEAAATTGIVGLAVMIFLLVRMFTVQFRLVRNRKQEDGARLVSLALIIASIAYVVHGMMDDFLWQTGVAFLLFTYLGLTSWLDHKSKMV